MSSGGVGGTDEGAVKARLLFDGDGTGEERRLNLLFRSVVKWSNENSGGNPGNPDQDVKIHAKLVSQLMQIEWSDAKSKLVQEMTVKEAKKYELLLDKIRAQITSAEAEIKDTKQELEQARLVRRNRMEYDAMARQINNFPSREETGRKTAEILADLESLKAKEEELDLKLQTRKNQFHVLVNSIHQLQTLLDQEEEEASNTNTTTASKLSTNEDSIEELNTSNVSSCPEESNMDLT